MAVELTPEEQRHVSADNAAFEFARRCRVVEESTSADAESALPRLVNSLTTELWDNGFSQDEIRQAFNEALDDMNRYAGGKPRNGTGIRGTAPR